MTSNNLHCEIVFHAEANSQTNREYLNLLSVNGVFI